MNGFLQCFDNIVINATDRIDEGTGFQFRKDIYAIFFAIAPAGQDYFKQSNEYLHLIATKALVMT